MYRHRYNKQYAGMWGHYCAPEWWRVSRSFKYNGQPKKKDKKVRWKTVKKNRITTRYPCGSWKKSLKHFAARKHRVMERTALSREDWDSLSRNSYKEAENPWHWD
jgi:hypothetical protein